MAEYKSDELSAKKYFNPSQKEIEVVTRVHSRFLTMKTERDKPRRAFGGRTLEQYVLDSVDAYNGIVSDEIKAQKDDWQSLIWDHKTRGKVKTTVAMIVAAKPFISLIGKSRKADKYATDMMNIYEDSWKQENGSYKLFQQALSAAVKGTVVTEEMYVEEKVKRKDIKEVNEETGAVTYVEKEYIKHGAGRVESEITDILSFYPNENSWEIEHDCGILKKFTRKAFQNKYGKYPNADVVLSGNFVFDDEQNKYKEETTTPAEMIEVFRYYNEDWDEFIILANNIWINKQDEDQIAPIPFDHKRLPFQKTVFETADEKQFYGKSLPDLMSGEQDATNALERLMVDREILSLNRGFVLGAGVEIDSYELYPGSVKKITGGNPNVPINQQFLEQDVSGANQSGFQMLQMLKSNSDINTSIDATAQGVHSGRKTAREAVILDENAKQNAGPFQINIYKLLFDRAEQRVSNIKQFYTSPVQYAVLKDAEGFPVMDEEGEEQKKPVYRSIAVAKPGKHPFWIDINPEMKGCEFDIRFVEDYEMPQSQSSRMELSKAVLDEAKKNPLINADEATIDYLESMRKDPGRFYIKPKPKDVKFQMGQDVPPVNQPAPVGTPAA